MGGPSVKNWSTGGNDGGENTRQKKEYILQRSQKIKRTKAITRYASPAILCVIFFGGRSFFLRSIFFGGKRFSKKKSRSDFFFGRMQNFLYNIFSAADLVRRRQIIRLWHSVYPVNRKRHHRPADIFEEFISTILYEPCIFKMRSNHFCCFGRGSDALQVPYIMLEKDERAFLVQLFAEREAHFAVLKQFANQEFNFETKELTVVKQTWRREIVREFAWLVMAKQSALLVSELIAAVQRVLLSAKGKADLFVSALHFGIQGVTHLKEVPCWDLDWYDEHEEARVAKAMPTPAPAGPGLAERKNNKLPTRP